MPKMRHHSRRSPSAFHNTRESKRLSERNKTRHANVKAPRKGSR